MQNTILVLIGTQCLYTVTDIMGRQYMVKYGFSLSAFISLWFLIYIVIRQVATFGQLYVFTHIQLGKTMAMLGAISIVLSNIIGFLYLGEKISFVSYMGILLAILAFMMMAVR